MYIREIEKAGTRLTVRVARITIIFLILRHTFWQCHNRVRLSMKSSAITIVSGLAVERLDCLPGKAILHSKESVHSPSVTPAVRF